MSLGVTWRGLAWLGEDQGLVDLYMGFDTATSPSCWLYGLCSVEPAILQGGRGNSGRRGLLVIFHSIPLGLEKYGADPTVDLGGEAWGTGHRAEIYGK